MRSEVRMDERSGGAGKSAEEVLTWTGVSWTGGWVATEEGATVREEEGTEAVGEVKEEVTVVEEAGEMVCVLVKLSILA